MDLSPQTKESTSDCETILCNGGSEFNLRWCNGGSETKPPLDITSLMWNSKMGETATAGQSYSFVVVAADGLNGVMIWAAGTAIDGTIGKTNPFVAM
ncbi:hypothetical protein PROFUN_12515 [Planoprotostelium fungivorum]|uniref:Uncharacterized protein n=1 Tax=Planoprotostelium fungivorum TaxID=1890364 RepID=A0A2P6MS16_9EUKA|nr:hypothetical protein PROFUN_12515 [Planoprotostelium fungivorum]